MWNVAEKITPVYQVAKISSPEPAFDSTKKYMALGVKDGIAIFAVSSGMRVGFLSCSGSARGRLAFSPTGTKLAMSSGGRVQAWDLTTHTLTQDFDWDGSGHESLDWIDDDRVLIDGKYVVDVPHRVLVWTYEHTNRGAVQGNSYWYFDLSDRKKPMLASGVIPSPAAAHMLKGADPGKPRADSAG